MAAGNISLLPDISTSAGFKTITDLYDFINGQTRTTSGGTQTSTESSSIDKSTMDALMKTALESTSGLSAIASGQRAAGGYNSSTNQMLINDLMTRTAQQIAASNKTTTRTTTTAPQRSTQGGLTLGGGAKTAGFIGAIQALDKLGVGSLFKRDKKPESTSAGSGGAGFAAPTAFSSFNPADFQADPSSFMSVSENPSRYSYDNNLDFSLVASLGRGSEPASFDFGSVDTTPVYIPPPVESTYNEFFADGGLVRKPMGYADGGEVTRKKSLLGSTQVNTFVETPEGGTTSGANSYVAPTSTVGTNPEAAVNEGGGPPGADGFGGEFSAPTGGGPTPSQVAQGIGILGNVLGEPAMGMAGTALGVLSSRDPVRAGLMAGANIATRGAAGAVANLANNFSLGTLIDLALSRTPVAPLNALSSLLFGTTLGKQIDGGEEGERDRAEMRDVANLGARTAYDPFTGAPSSVVPGTKDALGNYVGERMSRDPNSLPVNLAEVMSAPTTVAPMDDLGTRSLSSAVTTDVPVVADAGGDAGGYGGVGGDTGGADTGGFGGEYATGGEIDGPGTGTSDSIPIRVSDGEYILPKRVVDVLGVNNLDKLVMQINGRAPNMSGVR